MANFQLQSLISPKTGNLKGKDNKGKDGEDEEEPNIISASRSALLVRGIYDFITTTRCMAGSTCEMRRESFFLFRFRFKTFSHLILERQQSPRFVRITIFDAHPPASCRERGQKKTH